MQGGDGRAVGQSPRGWGQPHHLGHLYSAARSHAEACPAGGLSEEVFLQPPVACGKGRAEGGAVECGELPFSHPPVRECGGWWIPGHWACAVFALQALPPAPTMPLMLPYQSLASLGAGSHGQTPRKCWHLPHGLAQPQGGGGGSLVSVCIALLRGAIALPGPAPKEQLAAPGSGTRP